MPELRRRLLPFGAFIPSFSFTGFKEAEDALATRLHINSFSGDRKQAFVELLPLPTPYASRMEMPERVFPVTVISSDGREKPVMFGLPITQVIGSVLSGLCSMFLQGYTGLSSLQCDIERYCLLRIAPQKKGECAHSWSKTSATALASVRYCAEDGCSFFFLG